MKWRMLFHLYLLLTCADASGPIPVSRSGLAGINGFTFYDPYCAHGCFRSFSPFMLSCSDMVSPGGHVTADTAAKNLATCRSSNFPFLSSIAWCTHLYCPDDVRASTIEKFWQTQITGDIKTLPEWTYGEVLAMIKEPPTTVATGEDLFLNTTMLTTYDNWRLTQDTLIYFFRETAQESYYGLAICLTAFGLPLILTWVQYLPYLTHILEWAKPYAYGSILGTYHDRPLPYLLGNVPTAGQGLYIGLLLCLNIIFLAVGYKTLYPHHIMQWYENRYQELMAYFMWRTGVLAFCQMPVLFLFSCRNNVLLWLTNWSHSTYMLLHRWIARLFLLQTLLHSILALVLYQDTGSYAESVKLNWWIWGVVATVAAVFLILTSLLIFRQRAYELFLVTHIVMAIICVVGCWYHVWYGYENTFGYETWLYATIAIWFSDRLIRLGRILKSGVQRATVTDVGATIARIDIPGVRWNSPGSCVYVYFPTLNPLRPWANHPFSIIPTSCLARMTYSHVSDRSSESVEKGCVNTIGSRTLACDRNYTTAGLTLFVRKRTGMTGTLQANTGLLTLLEGPYPTMHNRKILQSDRLLLIGGGIGITGILPYINHHPNIKLFYSVKTSDSDLVDILAPILEQARERKISIGQRLSIDEALGNETTLGWKKIAVVVCGPASMCDDTRSAITRLGRTSTPNIVFELAVDAFSW